MTRTALKLVERPGFYREEGQFWSNDGSQQIGHSLQYVTTVPGGSSPEFSAFAVERFSKRGDFVLDPFCGDGSVVLEAALRGRVPFASDSNPLSVLVADAKMRPADISEVTLRLQGMSLRRPVAVELFRSGFHAFFALETFRELVGLQSALQSKVDRVSRFIEMLALGLLHGPSAGYFSVYSMPSLAATPLEQEQLNAKRGQVPDYRALVPRLLRRCATATSDGISSSLSQYVDQGRCSVSESTNLSFLPSSSIGVVITSPPLPNDPLRADRYWLKAWFAGIDRDVIAAAEQPWRGVQAWTEKMNESLLEFARVVRTGGRVVLNLRGAPHADPDCDPTTIVQRMVEHEFARFWDLESLLVHRAEYRTTRNVIRRNAAPSPGETPIGAQVLVLRRR